jgi:hypothetical protein
MVTMNIYEGTGFNGALIASETLFLDPATLPSAGDTAINFLEFDFSGTSVVAGQTYSAAVTSLNARQITVGYLSGDIYTSGKCLENRGRFT